ncbi:hypothetical protein ES703_124058 [subsurface metagenome]
MIWDRRNRLSQTLNLLLAIDDCIGCLYLVIDEGLHRIVVGAEGDIGSFYDYGECLFWKESAILE